MTQDRSTTPDRKEAPHVRAAFINAIADEGTKDEAIRWLQKTWNELCQAESELRKLRSDMERAQHNHAADLTFAASTPNSETAPPKHLPSEVEEAITRAARWLHKGAPQDEAEATIRDVAKLSIAPSATPSISDRNDLYLALKALVEADASYHGMHGMKAYDNAVALLARTDSAGVKE